jgi:LPS sulfotransferase NodH
VSIIVPPTSELLKLALEDPVTEALPLRNGASVVLPEGLSYVFIVFTCRTGSFYLAELLATSGFFNKAAEALALGPVERVCREKNLQSFSEYFADLARNEAKNGFFVVKANVEQLVSLAWHGVLQRIAVRSRFIVTERMDKLAQAISWLIAVQTGKYRSNDQLPAVAPVYDGEELRNRLNRVVQEHAEASLFFALNGLVPLHVCYERMIAAPLVCSRIVCKFLGRPDVACDPALVPLRRQATGVNREWRARFLAEQARSAAPP